MVKRTTVNTSSATDQKTHGSDHGFESRITKKRNRQDKFNSQFIYLNTFWPLKTLNSELIPRNNK